MGTLLNLCEETEDGVLLTPAENTFFILILAAFSFNHTPFPRLAPTLK